MLRANLKDQVVVLKLITREEVVGKVVEETDEGHLVLDKPLAIVVGRESLQLIPFQFAAHQARATIFGYNLLIAPIAAPAELEKVYLESTREITLDTSSVTGINLRN